MKKSIKHMFKTYNNKFFNTRFKIGDVVRIKDSGQVYTTYKRAFEFFNILDFTKKSNSTYYLKFEEAMKLTNWIVVDMALHSDSDQIIIYHIVNQYGKHLVIGENGICKRYIKLKSLKGLIKENDNFIIYKI